MPALDPRRLKPSQLLRYLNSTPLGTVLTERRLYSHRMAAGLRIGSADGKTIDLLRYTAWLCAQRHGVVPRAQSPEPMNCSDKVPEPKKKRRQSAPAKSPRTTASSIGVDYEAHKERSRARQASMSRSGRDIGDLPPVKDPKRRAAGKYDLRTFCETYFPHRFTLRWSEDHLRVISRTESAVLDGMLNATAMPRGSGKTSLVEVAIIWAELYGHRHFATLIGADKGSAVEILDSIKVELETNELLAEDFPEVCYPISKLEGITQRAKGQLYKGQRTRIVWTENEIVLPTIEGSAASGAIIKVAGITGRIRGLKHTLPDGTVVRPDFAFIDDPQTEESAHSPIQNERRLRTITGAILGLAGPGKRIAAFCACTVIAKGDVADQLLDREKHPDWQGERCKLVYSWPTNEKLWQQYAQLRADGLRNGDGGKAATEFYRNHRKEMDAGAHVAWPDRYDREKGEISAIQHAWNLRLRDEVSFFAEYQNDPIDQTAESAGRLKKQELEAKAAASAKSGVDRGIVPLYCHKLVAFIDVQAKLLWWMVCGFGDHWTGAIIDAGVYPEQGRTHFTNADAKKTYAKLRPGAGFNAQLYGALLDLTTYLNERAWHNEQGLAMRLSSRPLIDANWGKSTEIVFQFCRESNLAMPSHGRGIGASQLPINEYARKPGDQVGHYWRVPAHAPRGHRYVLFDTNFWKSFAADRLRAAQGDHGCVNFFREKRASGITQMLIEHFSSEYPITVEGRGRTVDEWKLTPGQDNHWWDCFVGCCVAASMVGVSTVGQQSSTRKRPKRKLSEIKGRRM